MRDAATVRCRLCEGSARRVVSACDPDGIEEPVYLCLGGHRTERLWRRHPQTGADQLVMEKVWDDERRLRHNDVPLIGHASGPLPISPAAVEARR